jgi:exopolyphosphatase / guanosine-5'-triphosphate,3'-diphosphate pyrophosphatase
MNSKVMLSLVTAISMATTLGAPSIGGAVSSDKTVSNKSECLKTRAAFDVGSGQTKMKVFEVDACAQTAKQIYPEKDNKQQDCESRSNLPFKRYLDLNIDDAREKERAGKSVNWKNIPRFQIEFLEDGVDLVDACNPSGPKVTGSVKSELKRLVDIANRFNPDDRVGVATEAFRESTNSDYVVGYLGHELGIRLLVPTGPQEALIEWMSTTTDVKSNPKYKNIDPNSIITVGIGNGSMQIGSKGSDGNFAAFASTLASDNIVKYAVENVRGGVWNPDQPLNLLPMSHDEIKTIVDFAKTEAKNAPDTVKARIAGDMNASPTIIGVGGVINKAFKSGLERVLKTKADYFTIEDVNDLLEAVENKSVDSPGLKEMDSPEYAQQLVPNAALVLGVMKGLRIQKIWFSKVDNTLGALFTKEYNIKMQYVKPVVESEAVKAARENRKVNVAAAVTHDDTSSSGSAISSAMGSSDENEAVCSSTKHTMAPGNVCQISEPCWAFTDMCSNKAGIAKGTDKTCKVPGKTTLVYKVCGA